MGQPATAGQFVVFGPSHWGVLLGISTASLILCGLLRRTAHHPAGRAVRRGVCWGLAAILLGGAIGAEAYRAVCGIWSLQESLPLHLCDLAVLVTFVTLIGAGLRLPLTGIWQRLYELAYTWAIGGTLQAVLTPDLAESFPNPFWISYFVLHGTILVAVLVMTLGLRARPQPGTPRRVWLVTFCLAGLVMLIDWAIGANYMYLMGPPAHPSLYDYFGPWPWSLLSLAVVGTGLIWLCYLPFWLADRCRRRPNRGP